VNVFCHSPPNANSALKAAWLENLTVETVICEMSRHLVEAELFLPAGVDFLVDDFLIHGLTVFARVQPI
jgi:hypothetical protein